MRSFTTTDTFRIHSRERMLVHCVNFESTPHQEIKDLVGKEILLDGRPRIVRGVEMPLILGNVTCAGFLVDDTVELFHKWLKEELESHEHGGMMSMAESIHGAIDFKRVLEKFEKVFDIKRN